MDDRPTLDQVNVVVRDVGATVEFYRLLGVAVDDPPAPWTHHHRTVESPEGVDLEIDSGRFAPHWNVGWPDDRTGTVLGFRETHRDTVDAIYTRLTAAGAPRAATALRRVLGVAVCHRRRPRWQRGGHHERRRPRTPPPDPTGAPDGG